MGLLAHLVAVFGLAWSTTSLVVGALVFLLDRRLSTLHPRAQARIVLLALSVPLLIAMSVVLSVVVPHGAFGLVDHCLDHPGHLHLCVVHGAPLPHPVVAACGTVAALWTAGRLAVAGRTAFRGERAFRRVVDAARREGTLTVLPGVAPVAFTAGLFAPRVVVSERVLAEPTRWQAVIEHERAHAAARDPLMRWVSEALRAFHLPAVHRRLASRLRQAQELAADDAAAVAIGSRVDVAETLIAWMQWARADQATQIGFDSAPFALRIHRLLETDAPRSGPSGRFLAGCTCAALVAIGLLTLPLHHAVETALGLLPS